MGTWPDVSLEVEFPGRAVFFHEREILGKAWKERWGEGGV
jgi:hypothetical protein